MAPPPRGIAAIIALIALCSRELISPRRGPDRSTARDQTPLRKEMARFFVSCIRIQNKLQIFNRHILTGTQRGNDVCLDDHISPIAPIDKIEGLLNHAWVKISRQQVVDTHLVRKHCEVSMHS